MIYSYNKTNEKH